MPFDAVMDDTYCFKPREQLIDAFRHHAALKNPTNEPVVLTCQRGITACIIDFALRTLGNPNTSVYDGSLEEYA